MHIYNVWQDRIIPIYTVQVAIYIYIYIYIYIQPQSSRYNQYCTTSCMPVYHMHAMSDLIVQHAVLNKTVR